MKDKPVAALTRTLFVTDDNGNQIWAFSISNDRLMLCVKGEVAVTISMDEQLSPRTVTGWKMLLLSRGMLSPIADSVGEWMAAFSRCKIDTISDGDSKALDAAVIQEKQKQKQTQPDEKQIEK
jgi:hypothetical protein